MTLGETNINLPWVEKYRPSKLEDLVSHDDIITTISRFMKENQLPHLLFYGPPGTGKTSTILACARQMYTPQQFNSMVLELNASDDRGIAIVRGQILSFASTRTIFKAGPKLIILDEADAMTNDAQNALRRNVGSFFNLRRQNYVHIDNVFSTIRFSKATFQFTKLLLPKYYFQLFGLDFGVRFLNYSEVHGKTNFVTGTSILVETCKL